MMTALGRGDAKKVTNTAAGGQSHRENCSQRSRARVVHGQPDAGNSSATYTAAHALTVIPRPYGGTGPGVEGSHVREGPVAGQVHLRVRSRARQVVAAATASTTALRKS